jgi:FixJ family two-component response regulator
LLEAADDSQQALLDVRCVGVEERSVRTGNHDTRHRLPVRVAVTASPRAGLEGLTNREVAERLFVSPHTVNSHLRHVFAKLGINSRVELARLARDYEMA